MKIGILGHGNVAKRLAQLFADSGHDVMIGLRSETKNPLPYQHGGLMDCAKFSDAIVLAIPYTACKEVLSHFSDAIIGKIIIDVTNPLNADWTPLLLGQESSAAEQIADAAPKSYVVKAFNTVFADVMHKEALMREGKPLTAFIASDSDNAKTIVMALAKDAGFMPLDVGPLKMARYLEGMAHLNIQIAIGQGGGTNAAFLYHQVKAVQR
jgi:8-hydroxy-5-deazaflavin:NADPH oxidoreductase